MDSQELMKLTSEIKASFDLEKLENIQSILNDILPAALQKQCMSADTNLTIDIVLNYNQSQAKGVKLEQEVQQSSLINQEQIDELSKIILKRCVWTSQGFKCS